MTDQIEKPYALVSPYYGWQCEIIKIGKETEKTVSAIKRSDYSGRWSEAERRITKDKVIARFSTEDEAVAAMQAGIAAARDAETAVTTAQKAFAVASEAQTAAWRKAIGVPND